MEATAERGQVTWPVAALRPNRLNPRGPVDDDPDLPGLADSIREHGVLVPLVVVANGDGTATVVAGHRRLAAARLAGLAELPVVVRPMAAHEQLEAMLVENLQRSDLTPLQEARAYALLSHRLSRHEIARRLGIGVNRIDMALTVLKLDPEVQAAFGRREMPMTAAHPLSRLTDARQQRRLAARVATRRMTVPQLEKAVERLAATGEARPRPIPASAPKPRKSNWPSRGEALAMLRAEPDRTIRFADLARAFDLACHESACAQCGLADLEAACRECPGPLMVARLAGRR